MFKFPKAVQANLTSLKLAAAKEKVELSREVDEYIDTILCNWLREQDLKENAQVIH